MRKRIATGVGLSLVAACLMLVRTSHRDEGPGSVPTTTRTVTLEPPTVLAAPSPLPQRPSPQETGEWAFELIITREGHQLDGVAARVLAEDETDTASQTTAWRLVSQGVSALAPLVLSAREHGRHLIEVTPPGTESPTFVYVVRQPTERLQRVSIELEPSQAIEVTVEDARHKVVPRAHLMVTPTFGDSASGELPSSTQRSYFSNDSGQVRINLTRGRYVLEASRSPVERASVTLEWPSTSTLRITLAAPVVFEGQVLLPDGGPASNAMVYDYFEKAAGPQTLADRGGRFAFEVEPGLHRLGAELAGLSGSTDRIDVAGGARRSDIVIRLASTARMFGVVTDALKHHPIANATVSITPNEVSGEVSREVTDADGGWSALVPAGRWDIDVTHAGYQRANHTDVVVAPGLDFSLDMVLEPFASLHGTLRTRLGAPVAGAAIAYSFRENGSPRHLPRTTTTTQGEYVLKNVPSGEAFLVVTPPNGRQFNVRVNVPMGADLEKDIMMPESAQWVRGEVIVHGKHQGEASVAAFSENETVDFEVIDGGFARELAVGRWVLEASFGGDAQRREVVVNEQQSTQQVFEFQPRETRVLRVVDVTGSPRQTMVFCFAGSRATLYSMTTVAGLVDVPKDSVQCVAGDERTGGSVELSPGDAPLSITLASTQLTLAFQRQGRPFTGVCKVTLHANLGELEQLMSGSEITFDVAANTAFRVTAHCPGTIDQRVDSSDTPSRVILDLDAYGTAAFHVLDQAGHAVPRAAVVVNLLARRTDAHGDVSFALAEGHYVAVIQGASNAVQHAVDVNRGQTTQLTVSLP